MVPFLLAFMLVVYLDFTVRPRIRVDFRMLVIRFNPLVRDVH